jgi:hypothetical protein
MQLTFNILSILFILWQCFRWSTSKFIDSLMKVFLFLLAMIGIFILKNTLKL